VELHQSGINSGDDVFGMKMTATIAHFDPVQLTQPTNQIVVAPSTVTLVAEALGDPGAQFQWYEDGAPISGAMAAVYSFGYTNPCATRSFSAFFCEVQGTLCTYRTRTATVQFVHDDLPPLVRSVRSGAGLTNLYVEFDEMVLQDFAEDPFAYTVSRDAGQEFNVLNAFLQADQRTVMLTLEEPLSEGAIYTLQLKEGYVTNLCGLPAWEAVVPFQAWTRDVPLRITRISPDAVRLDWADASFGLEGAPSPSGPWASHRSARSGDVLAVYADMQFFRLRRIPE
jgi:hypothetical protein